MVLVDTNIIIDIWKNENSKYNVVFQNEQVCICGVVKSELLHGAYSSKNLDYISSQLNLLTEYNIHDSDWSSFGKMLYNLRINGITLPYADALIAFIAINNNLSILTEDKHFKLIQVIYPELNLYDVI